MTKWLGLQGRRAVVAGAGGIGSVLAAGLRGVGAAVVVIDRDPAKLDEGDVVADLTSAAGCRTALERAADRLGGLDVFIHAVGINDRRPVLDTPDEVWDDIVAINLSSAFWLGRAAGRLMVDATYGRMVFLSSVSGLLAHPHHAPYAATKGGVNQLLRVMAREWAASGVTVNAVAPGYIETDLTAAYLAKPGMRESMETLVPAGRLGVPEDLVGPVLFLASDRAAFVTGQVLFIDGGRTLV